MIERKIKKKGEKERNRNRKKKEKTGIGKSDLFYINWSLKDLTVSKIVNQQ